ncbi:MAG: hypothetical protein PUF62_09605, partial [Bacteroidales bacterium]|nr:hypothetical protein [Bacteroidales bacterium]
MCFLFLRFVLCFDGIISETDAVQNPSFFVLPNERAFLLDTGAFLLYNEEKGGFLMVRDLMHDPLFLGRKSAPATKEDLQTAQDLL